MIDVLLERRRFILRNLSFSWLSLLTLLTIKEAFLDDGPAVIQATNVYLNGIAASDRAKAQALAGFINEDPMMVCSLGLQPQRVTMPIRWCESDGDAYINPNVKFEDSQLDFTFRLLSGNTFGNAQFLFGYYNGSAMSMALPASNVVRYVTNNAGDFSNISVIDLGTSAHRVLFSMKTNLFIDGIEYNIRKTTTLPSNELVSYFFGRNLNGTDKEGNLLMAYSKFKIGQKRDYVPFKRTDGECGMLDLNAVGVEGSQTFYGNAGTGQFTIPDISYTPSSQTT